MMYLQFLCGFLVAVIAAYLMLDGRVGMGVVGGAIAIIFLAVVFVNSQIVLIAKGIIQAYYTVKLSYENLREKMDG